MVKCPLCDYEGTEREVKAHISGKSDSAHKGFVGDDFEGYFAARRNGDSGVDGSSQNTDGKKSGSKSTDSLTEGDRGRAAGSAARSSKSSGGKRRVRSNGLPEIRCGSCGREVKYPEMMPYKATCPDCGTEMREREAFEKLEEKADEPGKDEFAEPVEV
mgnify:CR=1 FL=1